MQCLIVFKNYFIYFKEEVNMKKLFFMNQNEGRKVLRKEKGVEKIVIAAAFLVLAIGFYYLFQDTLDPLFAQLMTKVTENFQSIIGTP